MNVHMLCTDRSADYLSSCTKVVRLDMSNLHRCSARDSEVAKLSCSEGLMNTWCVYVFCWSIYLKLFPVTHNCRVEYFKVVTSAVLPIGRESFTAAFLKNAIFDKRSMRFRKVVRDWMLWPFTATLSSVPLSRATWLIISRALPLLVTASASKQQLMAPEYVTANITWIPWYRFPRLRWDYGPYSSAVHIMAHIPIEASDATNRL